MNDPSLVREREPGQDVDDDVELRLQREHLAHLQQFLEVDPVDELHGDEQVPADVAHVVDGDDVGMLERRCRLGLVQEPLAQVILPGDGVVHDLDGDGPVEDGIPGLVHDTHRALAYELDDVVLADVGDLDVSHGHAASRSDWPCENIQRGGR